jgi:F-type H+-transporting ATPase subunit a
VISANPLQSVALFHVGPVPITEGVVTTWVIMLVLTLISWLGMRRAKVDGGPLQSVLEIVVETIANQIKQVVQIDPWPFLPLVGTLFIYVVTANLAGIVPGAKAPTAHIETPAALALVVFFSTYAFGIYRRGIKDFAGRYLKPNPLLLPLNFLSEITRSFSLMIRLFGNMMSHEFVIALVVFLAGLFVPVPFLLLGALIGIIQAYIFSVLATVYLAAAVGSVEVG